MWAIFRRRVSKIWNVLGETVDVEQRERLGYQTLREIGTESFCGEVENQYSPGQSCEAQGHPTLREIWVGGRHGMVHLARFTLFYEIVLRARSDRTLYATAHHP